jgi:hypothetical protein
MPCFFTSHALGRWAVLCPGRAHAAAGAAAFAGPGRAVTGGVHWGVRSVYAGRVRALLRRGLHCRVSAGRICSGWASGEEAAGWVVVCLPGTGGGYRGTPILETCPLSLFSPKHVSAVDLLPFQELPGCRIPRPCLNKDVRRRRLEMATDARSRDVQGHVVRSSIVVSPGGPTFGAAAAPTACPNTVSSTPPLTPDPAPGCRGRPRRNPWIATTTTQDPTTPRACIRPHVLARAGWRSYVRNRVCVGTQCRRLTTADMPFLLAQVTSATTPTAAKLVVCHTPNNVWGMKTWPLGMKYHAQDLGLRRGSFRGNGVTLRTTRVIQGVRNTCAWYEMKAQHETKKVFTRYEIFV